ncbi:class I SAM-dependent methyltransferase [Aminobacter sp. NyZ550]|jgi:predicted TPR repeat methyltransferase|uniref:class I SAM-dependent DNA methyltransferase n=1 Tax=Aminobacter TaxID=31988 RepID=UPI0012B0EA29|nr:MULTISPECIES: class I SAM-dependent methyltransferase [unclassified Aminobacter]MRX36212.1 methyltransferase domain-containing protein [Aminobacter sp. MDW-2]QNH35393.1 class I SAM-dependent methyltransferase [Aminobacter sp. MDW-2]WAX96187.1 class I SAM-dependent methyltransferase [Aminobacter sp. NyZ550]
MTGGADKTALDMVYAAETEMQLAAAYAAWANGYDTETAALGYCLPFVIAAWVARHVPKGEGPLLDAGCGTGLSGPYLQALGYDDIEGLDFSEEMLELARARGGHSALTQAALGGPLPWADRHFAAVFSTGVFTAGHAPASSLDELVRITRPGGFVIFTVRDVVLEAGGFQDKFTELVATGRWQAVEESPAFRAFAVAEPDVLVKAYIFRVV